MLDDTFSLGAAHIGIFSVKASICSICCRISNLDDFTFRLSKLHEKLSTIIYHLRGLDTLCRFSPFSTKEIIFVISCLFFCKLSHFLKLSILRAKKSVGANYFILEYIPFQMGTKPFRQLAPLKISSP